jgi:hypothetical protein
VLIAQKTVLSLAMSNKRRFGGRTIILLSNCSLAFK